MERKTQPCWCGETELQPYHHLFAHCPTCHTLVCQVSHAGLTHVADEQDDYYGWTYWNEHQQGLLQLPPIQQRSREDLVERGIYWLKRILPYKQPPARVLEIGCGHGGLLALCQWIGFDVVGLELSEKVAQFAAQTFDIDVRHGALADQDFAQNSFDLILLMDVIEHVPDPVALVAECRHLLTPTGIIVLQTPQFKPDLPPDPQHPFHNMLIPREHLHLFSQDSLTTLLQGAGFEACIKLPALFSYDMILLAGTNSTPNLSPTQLNTTLESNSQGRLALLLLDMLAQNRQLTHALTVADHDRVGRMTQIEELTTWLLESEADRTARFEVIQDLTSQLRTLQMEEE